jgi:hypothetical protein
MVADSPSIVTLNFWNKKPFLNPTIVEIVRQNETRSPEE